MERGTTLSPKRESLERNHHVRGDFLRRSFSDDMSRRHLFKLDLLICRYWQSRAHYAYLSLVYRFPIRISICLVR